MIQPLSAAQRLTLMLQVTRDSAVSEAGRLNDLLTEAKLRAEAAAAQHAQEASRLRAQVAYTSSLA